MNLNIIAFIGVLLSYGGYIIAFNNKYFLKKQSSLTQIFEFLILDVAGNLLIFFSSKDYKLNLIFVLLANFLFYPAIHGALNGLQGTLSRYKKSQRS